MFERLSEVGSLTSRDIDLLTTAATDLANKTNTAAQAKKGCFDNFTLGNKECQHLVSLAGILYNYLTQVIQLPDFT